MKDKLKKKQKRFDYYGFLMKNKLFGLFCEWCEKKSRDRNSDKSRHDYIVSIGKWYDLTHSCFDFQYKTNVIDVCNEPWVRDPDGALVRRV